MSYYRRAWGSLVWGVVAAVALIAGLWAAHTALVDRAFVRGKSSATAGVVFDSVMVERAARRVAATMQRTDTVVQRVVVTRTRVESLVVAMPDSVRTLPPVDTLVGAVGGLLVAVDTLTHTITAERAAHTERARVDSAALYTVRVLASARGDTIRTLQRRPRWRTVATALLLGVAGGAAR